MRTEIISPTFANTSVKISNPSYVLKEPSLCDWHIHDAFEIFMIKNGEKNCYVGDRTYNLSKGDIMFVNRNIPHKTYTEKGSNFFLLQFKMNITLGDFTTPEYIFNFENSLKNDCVLFKKGTKGNEEIRECIDKIILEYARLENSYEAFIKAYVYQILAVLYRNNILKNPEISFKTEDIEKIAPVFEYVNTHFAEEITLEDVSRILNLDKSYFCRFFKKAVNTTFVNYLNFVRICQAEKLLLTTGKSVTEISYEVGFSSVAYFTKTFGKYRGCTPGIYKKVQKNKN